MSIPRNRAWSYNVFLLEGFAEVGCFGSTLKLEVPAFRGLSRKEHCGEISTPSALAELTSEITC